MVGGATPSTWNVRSNWPRLSEIADFQSIFAHSASAVAPRKTSINTNRKSTARFQMSLRWTSYVARKPQNRAKKRKTAVFRLKSHFAWRKSATKFLCVKNVSNKVVRHSFAYLPVYEWLVGDVPFYAKIWRILTHSLAKRRFSIYFRSYRLIRNT